MTTARNLALRDAARAALMGAVKGHSFGFGDDYGDDYGDDMGFGESYDVGFGAPRRGGRPARKAHPQAFSSTAARTLALDPNRDSTVKVQRYSFTINPADFTLSTPVTFSNVTGQPSTSIRPDRLVCNAPSNGFVTLSSLQIANVNVFVGGTEDAFTYGPLAQNVTLSLPRIDPQNRATVSGRYTGLLPAGYVTATAFSFVVSLQGPATLAGGYGQ